MFGKSKQKEAATMRLRRLFFLVAVFAFYMIGVSAPFSVRAFTNPNDLIIIVNNQVQTNRLTIEQVRSYFLYDRTSWSAGNRAVPINAKNAALRSAFRRKVLGMSASEEDRFWREYMVRTGKKAPPEFSNTMKAVYRLKGGISYVFRKDFKEGVAKVVLTIPSEP